MAVIACVDLDPLVREMVQRVRPEDEVVALVGSQVVAARWNRVAGVVMSAGSDAAAAIQGTPLADRTVLVGEEDQQVPPDHPGPVLRRPVEAADLRILLGRLVPTSGRWAGLRARTRTLSSSIAPEGIFAISRVATVAAAVALELAQPDTPIHVALVAVALVWAVVRVWARELSVGPVTLDVVVAVAMIVGTGGTGSAFLLPAAVVGAEVGWAYPPRAGAILIGVATLAGLTSLGFQWQAGDARALDLATWGSLIPLSSVAGVMGWRIQQSRHGDRMVALQDLHETLGRLARQAQGTAAGALEESAVVDRALDVVRDRLGARAAVVVLDGDAGLLRTVAGSYGLTAAPPTRLVVEPWDEDRIPPGLADLLPHGDAVVVELVASGVPRGSLTAVLPPGEGGRAVVRELRGVASETAIALDNARLFEGIREMTADTERRRLARDLHDGVVQSLVHVGFELDLVGESMHGPAQHEVQRLRRLVGQTVDEVRASVNGLRSVRLGDGLVPALAALADEYRSSELAVDVDADPVDGLEPEAELQLLRIAQEALSNAVQHGRPTRVVVRLWQGTDGQAHLQVADDGVGMRAGVHAGPVERGIGLRAMKERADLLGAELVLQPAEDGGTEVRVDVPTRRPTRE